MSNTDLFWTQLHGEAGDVTEAHEVQDVNIHRPDRSKVRGCLVRTIVPAKEGPGAVAIVWVPDARLKDLQRWKLVEKNETQA